MRRIAISAITLTILALLYFQPGVIGGYKTHRSPSRHLQQQPALFRSIQQPTFIPSIPVATPTTTTSTTTTSTTSIPPTTVAVVAISDASSTDTSDWACIKQAESGTNYAEAGGGMYQFEAGTWQATTGLGGMAEDYSPATQDAAALKLYSERGFEPWIADRYKCPWLF